MKKLKKAVSILLALVMILGMTGTAMADAPTTYTITINNGKTGHTYEAYQVFDGDLYIKDDDDKTDVLSNIEWGTGVNGNEILVALQNDATYGSDFSSCTDAADVADVLSGSVDDSALAQAFAQIVSENLSNKVAGTSTETSGPYTISGLEAGYYLVKDQDGSVKDGTDMDEIDAYTDIILEVVKNVTIDTKAVYPTIDKTVSDPDANIGDTVTYTLTGTVPDTSAYVKYTYIFTDTLSAGLTYKSDTLEVKVGSETLTKGTDYTVSESTYDETKGTTITITITDAKQYSNSSIVVTYDADLNSNAVIGNSGNENSVKITYSNNPNWDGSGEEPEPGNTPEDEVVTFTFELDVTKVDAKNPQTTLKDAEFVLYRGDDTNKEYVIVDGNNKVSGWTDTESSASKLKSADDGTFSIIGLDVGTYYLKETNAPDGYNLLANPVEVVIEATYKDVDGDGNDDAVDTLTVSVDGGDAKSGNAKDGIVEVTVENNAGATLPSTGGIGTTIFYVVGGILVVAAAVLLITKGRMSRSE